MPLAFPVFHHEIVLEHPEGPSFENGFGVLVYEELFEGREVCDYREVSSVEVIFEPFDSPNNS